MNKVCHIVGGGDFFGIRPTGEGDFIIAADKGLLYLQNLGITPNLVIGDFDSSDTLRTGGILSSCLAKRTIRIWGRRSQRA